MNLKESKNEPGHFGPDNFPPELQIASRKIIKKNRKEPFKAYSLSVSDKTATQSTYSSSHDNDEHLTSHERLHSESVAGVETFLFTNPEIHNSSNAVLENSHQNVKNTTLVFSQKEQQSNPNLMPMVQCGMRDSITENGEDFQEMNELGQFQEGEIHPDEQSPSYPMTNVYDNSQNRVSQPVAFIDQVISYSGDMSINIEVDPERNQQRSEEFILQSYNTINQLYSIIPQNDYSMPNQVVQMEEPFPVRTVNYGQARFMTIENQADIPRPQDQHNISGKFSGNEMYLSANEQGLFPQYFPQSLGYQPNNFSPEVSRQHSAYKINQESHYPPKEDIQTAGRKPEKTRATKNVGTIMNGMREIVAKERNKLDVSEICARSCLADVNEVYDDFLTTFNGCDALWKLADLICEIEGAENYINPQTEREEVFRITRRVIIKIIFDEGYYERWAEGSYEPGIKTKGVKKVEGDRREKQKRKEFLEEKMKLRDRFLTPSRYARRPMI